MISRFRNWGIFCSSVPVKCRCLLFGLELRDTVRAVWTEYSFVAHCQFMILIVEVWFFSIYETQVSSQEKKIPVCWNIYDIDVLCTLQYCIFYIVKIKNLWFKVEILESHLFTLNCSLFQKKIVTSEFLSCNKEWKTFFHVKHYPYVINNELQRQWTELIKTSPLSITKFSMNNKQSRKPFFRLLIKSLTEPYTITLSCMCPLRPLEFNSAWLILVFDWLIWLTRLTSERRIFSVDFVFCEKIT